MRKILLTVMMVSSLLAFNACTKDGEQGPAGLTGPAGPAGAPGAVGAAGATGADGTKILTGDAAPAAGTGADGDYYFDKTAKTLYGPKAAGAWPAGTSLAGAAGADGADGAAGADGATGPAGPAGADGASFMAGAVAPGANDGKVGDYYFNTATSTFIGPKQADGTWGANSIPLGSQYAGKTYYITPGISAVTEVANSRVYGDVMTPVYTDGAFDIFSSYAVTAGDMIRINQYPGWGDNREMIFETAPNNNEFTFVPQSAADLGQVANNTQVGARFRYSNNTTNPTATFTLTQNDIDRLSVDNGTAFDYLTYAKAKPSTVALGQNLELASSRHVVVSQSTTDYAVNYTGKLSLDFDALIPDFERYLQEGIVVVRAKDIAGGVLSNNGPSGWTLEQQFKDYVQGYIKGNVTLSNGQLTVERANTAALPLPANFALNMGTGQTVTANVVLPSTKRSIEYNVSIISGDAAAPTAQVYVGPETLTNPTVDANPVVNGVRVPRTFAVNYYSAETTNPYLTSNRTILPGDFIEVSTIGGGKPASFFAGAETVQIQVIVVPATQLGELQAKGISLNDFDALERFVSKR